MAQFKALTMADLIGSEMLLLEDGHCLREHALDVCLTAGVKEDRRFHATSLETLRHMVGEGMGITLLPELSIPRGHTSNDEIRYIPFADPEQLGVSECSIVKGVIGLRVLNRLRR